MTDGDAGTITRLLHEWWEGDEAAREELFPLVYTELKETARRHLSRERQGHTLQPTALVHEAYLRLAQGKVPQLQDRVHFFAVSARLMRQILVDSARRRNAEKRGGGELALSLDEARDQAEERPADVLALDEALQELETVDPRKGKIVELRFFGGLTLEETAELMKLSATTISKESKLARAWLFSRLRAEERGVDEGSSDAAEPRVGS